jgi:elongation factor G
LIIRGMGELHLEVIADRLKREFKLPVRVGLPQVVLLETLDGTAEATGVFEREQDDDRLYGEVRLKVEPAARGAGFIFTNKATEAFLSEALVGMIRDGAEEGTKSGPKEGYPMQDVAITLLSAGYREGWDAPLGYKIAAGIAFRKASVLAGSAIMEPIMRAEITIPEEHVGEVIGGVNSRRGRVEAIEDRSGDAKMVEAMVPLRRMFGYATELRSLTQGRGVFSMRLSHHDRT